MKERNIVTCILLNLVTCGIYGIYWMYAIHEDMKTVAPEPMTMSGIVVILLDIVTCGIFGLYWMYKMGGTVDALNGKSDGNTGLVYLLLGLFAQGLGVYTILQSELNKRATA